jgi:hypothetical protein
MMLSVAPDKWNSDRAVTASQVGMSIRLVTNVVSSKEQSTSQSQAAFQPKLFVTRANRSRPLDTLEREA